jgi:hypothetical protein
VRACVVGLWACGRGVLVCVSACERV